MEEETKTNFSVEDLEKLYNKNPDAFEMIGGLEIIETIFSFDDDQFHIIEPTLLQQYTEIIFSKESEQELYNTILAQNYSTEKLIEEYKNTISLINQIDFLSERKKDFLKRIVSLTTNRMVEVCNEGVKTIQIPCELKEEIKPPTYANKGDAGLDIYSPEEYTINPGETIIIPIGIKVAIPEGYAILIQPRSGQSVKTKLRIANTPGLIDSGFREEIGVIVENVEPPFKDIDYEFDENGEIHIKSILHGQSYTIAKGQRFAQMRLVEAPKAAFVEVSSVNEIGEDRKGGFGSSGQF